MWAFAGPAQGVHRWAVVPTEKEGSARPSAQCFPWARPFSPPRNHEGQWVRRQRLVGQHVTMGAHSLSSRPVWLQSRALDPQALKR